MFYSKEIKELRLETAILFYGSVEWRLSCTQKVRQSYTKAIETCSGNSTPKLLVAGGKILDPPDKTRKTVMGWTKTVDVAC